MKSSRVVAAFGLLVLAAASPARAHDTGFGHSRRTILFSARPEARDGRVSADEKDRYFAERARELARGWELSTAEGGRLEPVLARVELGHSLTQSYRFTVSTRERTMVFVDTNFSHKPGQVSILSGPGLKAVPQAAMNLAHAERISVVVTRTSK
jgi:hypothetical protein